MNVSSCWHMRFSGVTKVLGARGQKQYSGPPFWGAGARGLKVKCYTMEKLMPNKLAEKWKTSVFCCDWYFCLIQQTLSYSLL